MKPIYIEKYNKPIYNIHYTWKNLYTNTYIHTNTKAKNFTKTLYYCTFNIL